MTLLKNRKIAIIITVVVVLLAILFGVTRSLNRLATDIESMFYYGVFLEDQGFTQPALNSHLENLAQATLDSVSIFANHPELSNVAEDLRMARRELIDASNIMDKNEAFHNLDRAFLNFWDASLIELSDRDLEARNQFIDTFNGATTAIQNSAYNDVAVSKWNNVSGFAQLLRPFLPVDPPQTFGADVPIPDGVFAVPPPPEIAPMEPDSP